MSQVIKVSLTEMLMGNCRKLTLWFIILFVFSMPGIAATSLDGITIIKVEKDPATEYYLAGGEYLVMFISGKGGYGAFENVIPSQYGGCTSLAVPRSYTGTMITFGMNAEESVRKQRNDMYCPSFTVSLQNETTVLVESGSEYSRELEIILHVPLQSIDFGADHFRRHDIKGVSLGPVQNTQEVKGISAKGYGFRKKVFERIVGQRRRYKAAVRGEAAPAEFTGWPWDVLYYANYIEEFPLTSTIEAFMEAVIKKHGKPSTRYKQSLYMLWAYDIQGKKVDFDDQNNACAKSMDYWVQRDKLRRIHALKWRNPGREDLGAWGCGLIVEINGNPGSGGVVGYSINAISAYPMAIAYFNQRLQETEELKQKVEALLNSKPQL